MTHGLCSLTSCSSGPLLFYRGWEDLCRVKPELLFDCPVPALDVPTHGRAPRHSQQGCRQQREWMLSVLPVSLSLHCLHSATLSVCTSAQALLALCHTLCTSAQALPAPCHTLCLYFC